MPLRRGLMFVLSSPSGAGKSTLSRMLLAHDPALRMSVSVTTRAMRPGEIDGSDYLFVSKEQFQRMIEEDAFLEWAEVFGNMYGTPRAQIGEGLASGQDFLFDIDWQGTQQLYQRAGGDVVRAFLLPPSVDELRRRLINRATDSADVIAARMAKAQSEISHWDSYDYVLVNDDLDTCFTALTQILAAERLRRARRPGLIDHARALMA